jgi:hypothetical protein
MLLIFQLPCWLCLPYLFGWLLFYLSLKPEDHSAQFLSLFYLVSRFTACDLASTLNAICVLMTPKFQSLPSASN